MNPAAYYIDASEKGGEPPGRWWGPAAEALGFAPGQQIERESYDLLFGKRKAPDGTPLGRPPAARPPGPKHKAREFPPPPAARRAAGHARAEAGTARPREPRDATEPA